MGTPADKEYAAFEEKVKRTVYIDNLSPQVTEAVLKTALGQFGSVTNVQFIPNYIEQNNIPQCALVEMENAKQAKSIVSEMGNYPFMMSGMPRPVRARAAEIGMFGDRPIKPGRKITCRWVDIKDPDFEVAQKLKQQKKTDIIHVFFTTMAITTRDESDHESSSCSSMTVPDSGHSFISDLSFGSRSSVSLSSYSECNIQKPHKANQVAWEAMKRLRGKNGQVGLDHFRLIRRVGSGDIGNVYLCQLRNPGVGLPECFYAMKVVDREALAFRKKLQRAEMEKEILGMLDHPFLPTLYANFDVSHYSCLVMEFCPGGDLHAVRQRQPGKRFSISSAKFYAAETLLALEYLHMMGIVYRDLKPENVLVREEGHIMLSDFDLSLKCDVVPKLLQSKPNVEAIEKCVNTSIPSCGTPMQPVLSCFTGSNKKKSAAITDDQLGECREMDREFVAEPINARSKSFVGTHEYLAPEVISGLGHGSAVDWWTFGVFLYEMLYGKTPFKGENNEKTLVNIIKQPLTFPRMNVSSSKDLEEMVKVQDLISKLLMKNPKKRIGSLKGSVEIKRHEFFKGVNWALIRSVRPPEVPKDLQKIMKMKNITSLPKKLSKKEREATYQIPQHFDYF